MLTWLQAEWNRYKTVCAAEGVTIPTRDYLRNKVDDINRLIDHPWTEAELSDKFKRQNSLRAKYSGYERDDIQREIERAQNKGDEETAKRLQEKLDAIEIPRLAFKTSLSPQKKTTPKPPSQQEKLARLNALNRKINAEEVRKAQRQELLKAREIEAKLARGEVIEGDNSRRVKTRMKFVHNINEYDEHQKAKSSKAGTPAGGSGASTPANGVGTPNGRLLPHLTKLQEQRNEDKNALPAIHQPLTEDDVIGALDLDIDIEL